jgi:hypothetical protein
VKEVSRKRGRREGAKCCGREGCRYIYVSVMRESSEERHQVEERRKRSGSLIEIDGTKRKKKKQQNQRGPNKQK